MAIIHHTTLTPSKLELVAAWLPAQPWYAGHEPTLAKAGGFRLDDPAGQVGIEFMVVTDASGGQATTYHVPLAYRGEPLDSPTGLIGTSEHGVLGRRWVYDGVYDPVLVTQLVALIQGDAEPQAQSQSDTPDPTVTPHPATSGHLTVVGHAVTADGSEGTELCVDTADGDKRLLLRVHRILHPGMEAAAGVTAGWQLPDGDKSRGVFVTAQYA